MDRYEAMAARGKNKIPITSWSMVIRTGLILKSGLRFIPDGYAEDIDFTYRLLSVSGVVCFCETPLYVYIQNPGSMCNSDNDNVRGTAEIESYRRLIDYMSGAEPGYSAAFRKDAVVTMIRSSTRMDEPHYRSFAADEVTKGAVDKELSCSVDPELVFFKLFPRAYRAIVRTYMELIFYREGKTF
jgi:hypothetical protein